jgi:vitamin B12 transporter
MQTKKYLIATLLLPSLAVASEVQNEETIIVSDSRFEEPIISTLSPTVVITQEQIKKMQLTNFADIAKLLPGAEIAVSGGRGQASSVKVRGGSDKDTLILINGVRINSAYNGGFQINVLPVNQIERVEYIRGAKATVYGSQASASIINIITRPGFDETKFNLKGQYGSYKNRQGSVSAKYAISDRQEIKFAGGFEKEKGYNVHPVEGVNESDHHGYQNSNLMLDYQYNFDNPFQIFANLSWNRAESEFDGSYMMYHEYDGNFFENFSYELGTKFITDAFRSFLTLNYQKTDDYQQIQKNPYKEDRSANTPILLRTVNATWANEMPLGDYVTFGAGLDYNSNELKKGSKSYYSPIIAEEDIIKNWAGFTSLQFDLENFQLEGSGRYDHNNQYGGHFTYSVGAGYKFLDSYKLSLIHGSSFRAPSFIELYYPKSMWGEGGNPKLEPEKSNSLELSLSANYDLFQWKLSGYVTNYHDRIAYDMAVGKYESIDKARIRGVELESTFDILSLHNRVSADFKSPRDRHADHDLAYIARRNFKWTTWGSINDFDLSLTFLAASKRYTNTKNDDHLGGYSLWNAAVAYNVNNYFKVNGKIDNIFNKKYEYAAGYKTPETTLAVGFELNY